MRDASLKKWTVFFVALIKTALLYKNTETTKVFKYESYILCPIFSGNSLV